MINKKVTLFLFFGILFISLVSSATIDNIVNTKEITKDTSYVVGTETIEYNPIWEKYSPIEIKNWFNLGETLWSGALTEHTESCGEKCYSTMNIYLPKDGSLIDGIKFYTINKDNSRVEQNVREYNFYIKINEEEYLVDDFEYQCKEREVYIPINDTTVTEKYDCSNVKIGSHIEIKPLWELYNIGSSVKAGNYEVKLEAEKKPERTVDWVIETQGKWLDDWAVWGSFGYKDDLRAYWDFNQVGLLEDVYTGTYNGSLTGTSVSNGIIPNGRLINEDVFSTDYINISGWDTMKPTTEFTASIWFNTTTTGLGTLRLVDTEPSDASTSPFEMRMDTGGGIRVLFNDVNLGQSYNMADGKYHQFAVTWNSTNLIMYIDGVANITSGVTSLPTWTKTEMILGKRAYDNSQYFVGMLDEFGIWNRSLSPTEISELYNSGAGLSFFGSSITLNSPIDSYSSLTDNIDFNCSVNMESATVVNMSLWLNGINNETQTKTGTTNESIFNKNLPNGINNWTCSACDSDGDCGFATSNRTVNVDTSPPSIVLNYGNGTFNYGSLSINHTVNYTVTDSSLDSCWFDYNGVNTTIDCGTGIQNTTNFELAGGVYNANLWANDSVGNIGNKSFSWLYNIFEGVIIFNNATSEGTLEYFKLNITLKSGISLSKASLIYNNTNYSSDISYGSGIYSLSSSIPIPTVNENSNMTFNFNFTIEGTEYSSVQYIQSVSDLQLSVCGGVSNDTLLNMSLYDEVLRNTLVGDIEIDGEIISKGSGIIIETINQGFSNVSSASICFSPISSYDLYYLDLQIRYYSSGYVPEFYIIQQADMGDYPLNLSLYDLNSSASTKFLVKYQDENLISVEGAILQLLRKYISNGTYEIVEAPETSNEGTANLHIDLNTNKYRVIVVKDGVVLDTFDDVVFDCEYELSGECNQNLLGLIDSQNSITTESLNDFSYQVSETNTTVTTTFSIPSGTPSSINIQLKQVDMFGNSSLCNQTIYSGAGSIDCSYNETIGDSILYLSIYKDGELTAQKSYYIKESGGIDWLDNNLFIVLILLLSIIGMAITSPEWIIINGILVFVLAGGVWLVNGLDFTVGLSGIIWLLISAGILIYKLTRQEDR